MAYNNTYKTDAVNCAALLKPLYVFVWGEKGYLAEDLSVSELMDKLVVGL